MPETPILDFLFRLSLAVVLGALIGIERQVSHHTAGLKTNALVATGSALFVMLAGNPEQHPEAYSRIAAQIITGMGFLGGGVILRDGMHIRGLTTAATLWCAAAVGTLAGAGGTRRAMMGCVAVLAVNIFLKPISRRIGEDSLRGEGVSYHFRIRITCRRGEEQSIRRDVLDMVQQQHFIVQAVKTQTINATEMELSAEFYSKPGVEVELDSLVSPFSAREGVSSVDWCRVDP